MARTMPGTLAQGDPATAEAIAIAERALRPRARIGVLRRILADRTARIGLVIVVALMLMALFAPLIAPHDPLALVGGRLEAPSWSHPFGTDRLGRDLLSRVLVGTRLSLGTAFLASMLIMVLGVAVGSVAGYVGGAVDGLLMRVVDTILAFPSLILALVIAGLFEPGLVSLMVAMASVWWVGYARLIRGLILSVRERQFIDAARLAGDRPARILRRHILPNILPPVIVLATLEMGVVILATSALSFLGLGAQPPTPELGALLNDGRNFFFGAPHVMLFPGLAISLAVLGFNLLGDGLRDVLDPKLVQTLGRRAARHAGPQAVSGRVTSATRAEQPQADPPLLRIEDLRAEFRTRAGTVRAVDGVSFSIERGEVLAIVGESGGGKTATALSILGLLPQPAGNVTGGRVLLSGEDLLKVKPERLRQIRGDRISMVFQDPILNPVATVGNQVAEVIRAHRPVTRGEAAERAVELLDRVGIPRPRERARDYPHQFSGGMRQRAMIAMAIALEPDVLIADEPTTALDVSIQAQVLELLAEVRSRLGMAMILITHDLGVVAGVAQRVMVMYAGRKVEEASVRDLYQRPSHPYTRALLESTIRLDRPRSGRLPQVSGAPPSLLAPPPGCRFAPRCPQVFGRCRIEDPPMVSAGPKQMAACHLLAGEPPA